MEDEKKKEKFRRAWMNHMKNKMFIIQRYFKTIQDSKESEGSDMTLQITDLNRQMARRPSPAGSSNNSLNEDRRQSRLETSRPYNYRKSGGGEISENLADISGPLTEHALLVALQNSVSSNRCCTKIGTVTVVLNRRQRQPPPRLLEVTPVCSHLRNVVDEAVNQYFDTGQSQTIILSGLSGAGKTDACRRIQRHFLDICGGGKETDVFKHSSAALTVLHSLTTCSTPLNPHASRLGYYLENQITNGAIQKLRVTCYFFDSSRVVRLPPTERNYHVFYLLLSALSNSEKAKFHLQGYSANNLCYLSAGDVRTFSPEDNVQRLSAWTAALTVLGIPVADVLRILSAVLLLGNICFSDGPDSRPILRGEQELQSVASLLGLSSSSLKAGLTTIMQRVRMQKVSSIADAAAANSIRDALAEALFARTITAVVRRINCASRRTPQTSTINATTTSDSSQDSSEQSVSHGKISPVAATISVLDFPGFENFRTNSAAQLSMNIGAESLQHFYTTHILAQPRRACLDEQLQTDIAFYDNSPVLQVLTAPRTGIISLLDAHNSSQMTAIREFIQDVRSQHTATNFVYEPTETNADFGIRHFAEPVSYDAETLIKQNSDNLPSSIVNMFSTSSFGFAAHLFTNELKNMNGTTSCRICPPPDVRITSRSSGLCQDAYAFIQYVMASAKSGYPHFIQCLRTSGKSGFSRELVAKQTRALQLLETLHVMSDGLAHRIRHSAFINRFRILAPRDSKIGVRSILESIIDYSKGTRSWCAGKKYVLLSETCRKRLEEARCRRRNAAATIIQAYWRRRQCLKRWPHLKRHLRQRQKPAIVRRRHHSWSETPPPAIPLQRPYTIVDGKKVGFPQQRVMKETYNTNYGVSLKQGQGITVVGQAKQPGYVLVQVPSKPSVPVPFHLTNIRRSSSATNLSLPIDI